MKKFIILIIAFVLNINTVFADSMVSYKEIATNINNERLFRYSNKLTLNDQLYAAAKNKANHIMQFQYWAHELPKNNANYKSVSYFFQNSEYDYTKGCEILAVGYDNPNDIIDGWLNSKTHKECMLNEEMKDFGISVLYGNFQGVDQYLVVALFGNGK